MKFSTKLSPGRHSGYKIHHKIDPVDHAWREGATPKQYLNHAVFALPRSVVGARPKHTSIIRSCTLAEHGWREAKKIHQLLVLALPQSGVGARPNKYANYSFLRPREARVARGQPIPRLLVSALPRSVLGARPNKYVNYSFWRSREAWLA